MNWKSWHHDVLAELEPLRRYARVLTRDLEDADDLVHDTLVRAYERRATFRLSGGLRVWLLTIMHNTFVDGTRRRKSEALRVERAGHLLPADHPAVQEHSVRLAQIRKAFLALPGEQRAPLHLVTIEGLSYDEASTALGIPLGTLMSRISRARSALRAIEDAAPETTGRLRIVRGRHEH